MPSESENKNSLRRQNKIGSRVKFSPETKPKKLWWLTDTVCYDVCWFDYYRYYHFLDADCVVFLGMLTPTHYRLRNNWRASKQNEANTIVNIFLFSSIFEFESIFSGWFRWITFSILTKLNPDFFPISISAGFPPHRTANGGGGTGLKIYLQSKIMIICILIVQ